jgi:nicotinate-nucleotide adenylyltransferase
MRLGIMGGTFDPIHYGHLFIAEEARARFRLDQVLFVPNGFPPHKKDLTDLTPARHRYAMTLIATYSNPSFSCSPIEIQRSGPSYTVDTLTQLREQHPDAELFYITGVDAVAEILSWNQHEKVIQLATFIAAARLGFDLRTLKDRLPHAYLERILLLGSTSLGISSSEIRDRIRQRLPVRYLTSDAVLDYIVKHQLYGLPAPAPPVESVKEGEE